MAPGESREQEARALRYDRFLAHPPERVWDALTNPDDLMQWMAAEQVVIEGRVGGRFEIQGIVNGVGRVLAWEPLKVLQHDFQFVTAGAPKEGGIITYELQPEGTGTRLTMTFRSRSQALARVFERGQATTFDRLEANLDGKPMPRPHGH